MPSELQIKLDVLQMPPQNTNSVLVSSNDDCVIFDAWGQVSDWENLLTQRGLKLRAVYTTHGHPDHISAAPCLAEKYGVPWYLNSEDNDLIWWGNSLLDYFGLPQIPKNCKKPTELSPGIHQILPGVKTNVILTPGHSAGGVTFYFPDFNVLLIGDTIFQTDIGNYTFPSGSLDALKESITKIYNMNLPDNTQVVHGHGMETTIKYLKTENPYFKSWFCNHNCEDNCCGSHHSCCCGHCHKGN